MLLCALVTLSAAAQEKPAPDALRSFTVNEARAGHEPPLTENEPVYFIMGTRGGTNARFQLSFKYRLFDRGLGWGGEQPWLTGFYFGYTQASLWNLSSDSKPFRDTSYRPSLFWAWKRTDDKTWIDGLRAGYEHESNGKDFEQSRSIDTVFARPEWRWDFADGKALLSPRVDNIAPNAHPDGYYAFKHMGGTWPGEGVQALRINSDVITHPSVAGKPRRVKQPLAGGRWVGLVLLFSTETGALLAMFPDGVMQRLRVGAANGIALKRLAREDAATLALIGGGWQAGAQLMAALATRRFREVRPRWR